MKTQKTILVVEDEKILRGAVVDWKLHDIVKKIEEILEGKDIL